MKLRILEMNQAVNWEQGGHTKRLPSEPGVELFFMNICKLDRFILVKVVNSSPFVIIFYKESVSSSKVKPVEPEGLKTVGTHFP